MQLFRTQALDYQNRLHGEVFLVPPMRWQVIGWLLFLAVAAGIIVLTFGTYSRTVDARGVLAPIAANPADASSKSLDISAGTAFLNVPASQIASIKAGQKVSISLDGFPARDFGALDGRVVSVASEPAANLNFQVKIALAPSPQQRQNGLMLRSNWPVNGRIVIQQQSILSWLASPKPAGSAR